MKCKISWLPDWCLFHTCVLYLSVLLCCVKTSPVRFLPFPPRILAEIAERIMVAMLLSSLGKPALGLWRKLSRSLPLSPITAPAGTKGKRPLFPLALWGYHSSLAQSLRLHIILRDACVYLNTTHGKQEKLLSSGCVPISWTSLPLSASPSVKCTGHAEWAQSALGA